MNFAQRLILGSILSVCFFVQAQEVPVSKESQAAVPADISQPQDEPTQPQDEFQKASSVDPEQPQAESQEKMSSAAQRPLPITAAAEGYSKPMYFDQMDNGVALPPLELEYDLGDGRALNLGNVTFEDKNFYFSLLPLEKTHPELGRVLDSRDASKIMLVMVWPESLLSHGTVEMISRTGTVLWSYSFTEQEHRRWLKKLKDWGKKLVGIGVPAKNIIRTGIFTSQFAIDINAVKAPFLGQKEAFRFCLTQSDGRNSARMCSQRYGTKSSGRNVVMGRLRMDSTATRVLVQNEEAPLKSSISVPADKPASFFAELSTGESYEFVTLPNKLELMDIAETDKPNSFRIVGYGARPVGLSQLLNPDQHSALTRLLGFEATIGDSRKFWAVTKSKDEPWIYLPGRVGGIFKQKFSLSEIPREQSRVYLSSRTPTGTYIDGILLEGRKIPVEKITSTQNSAEENPEDPTFFTWRFGATESGKINRSYLNIEVDGKTYKSFFEIYKGIPRELSARFTGVQTTGEFIFMGELAYNQWFEGLFDWTNYWLSRQRWGISAKYFQSFNQLNVDSAGNKAGLSVMTVDLKYRGTPGLWGRDETVGGMFSYQNVTFGLMNAPMLGVGAFWARSIPKVFDDFFNLVPVMRYPKWVDMEFIYYVNSMNSNVTLISSMSLNFHGKVLWTDRIFGEAGFGIKRYGFKDSSLNRKAELNTFYGTVGLGINF